MHLGTVSESHTTTESLSENEEDKLTEFGNWFTWCQTCRHGGHASHIMHWFQLV